MGFVGNVDVQASESVMENVYTAWQDALLKFNNESTAQSDKAIATGSYSWVFLHTQQTLVRTMLSGLGIMIVVALCTLIISTQNIVIAVLATVCIGGVISMLLGLITVIGWNLGITKSVSVIIGVGYSFDGVAHLATAYVDSKEWNREERMRDALTELGISVLFGAISTLFAGIALTPAFIVFFTKFAILLIATVLLSLLWSLMFFPALLLVIGPQGEYGSILPFIKCLNCFKRKEKG